MAHYLVEAGLEYGQAVGIPRSYALGVYVNYIYPHIGAFAGDHCHGRPAYIPGAYTANPHNADSAIPLRG